MIVEVKQDKTKQKKKLWKKEIQVFNYLAVYFKFRFKKCDDKKIF